MQGRLSKAHPSTAQLRPDARPERFFNQSKGLRSAAGFRPAISPGVIAEIYISPVIFTDYSLFFVFFVLCVAGTRGNTGKTVMKIGMGLTKFLRASALTVAAALIVVSTMLGSTASADIGVTNCGAPIKSVVKSSYNGNFTTSSNTYVNVTGAIANVNVPAGQTRCVKVRFSAIISCPVSDTATQRCWVKPRDAAALFAFEPSAAMYAHETNYAAHSFEWATRLTGGSHPIQIQTMTNNGTLDMNSWTLNVEVAQ